MKRLSPWQGLGALGPNSRPVIIAGAVILLVELLGLVGIGQPFAPMPLESHCVSHHGGRLASMLWGTTAGARAPITLAMRRCTAGR
jgi:hypothetical protein